MRAVGAVRRVDAVPARSWVARSLGNALGTGAGLAGGWLATDLLEFPYVFDPLVIVAAVGVGVGASLLAGAYPAWIASRLDPVEAIRRR